MADHPAYQPGSCNIGSAEVERRRRAALGALIATVGIGAWLLVAGAPREARWLVALPLAGTIVGALQVRFRFCLAYGLRGIRNFGALGRTEDVADAAARTADRRTAAIRVGVSVVAAGLLALLFVNAPI